MDLAIGVGSLVSCVWSQHAERERVLDLAGSIQGAARGRTMADGHERWKDVDMRGGWRGQSPAIGGLRRWPRRFTAVATPAELYPGRLNRQSSYRPAPWAQGWKLALLLPWGRARVRGATIRYASSACFGFLSPIKSLQSFTHGIDFSLCLRPS